MNHELESRISIARRVLSEFEVPLLYGAIPPPVLEPGIDDAGLGRQFLELLGVADGLTAGHLVIFGSSCFSGSAPPAEETVAGVVIGRIVDDALVLKPDGTVWVAPPPWAEAPFQVAASLDDLLSRAFSPLYPTVVPGGDLDPWWEFLSHAGLRPG